MGWREQVGDVKEEELEEALRWANYPKRVRSVKMVVYANKDHHNLNLLRETAPFQLEVLRLHQDWKGTFDKLEGFFQYVSGLKEEDIVLFVDAFDVFGNGFGGHELLRRFFELDAPIVFAAEENVFPREIGIDAEKAPIALESVGLANASLPSRYLNAGGIMGWGW